MSAEDIVPDGSAPDTRPLPVFADVADAMRRIQHGVTFTTLNGTWYGVAAGWDRETGRRMYRTSFPVAFPSPARPEAP